VDLARTITNQAAIAFQNARLFAKTKEMTAELERRVAERTKELEEEHQRTQILLNIITELSASLDLDIVVNRTLALINEISGAEQSTVLLVKPEESAFLFLASHGYTVPPAEGGQMTWLSVDEGLAGWVLSEQKAALIHDLTEDERWIVNAERPSNHRSALAVPLLVGPEALGVLMLFHRQPKHFSADQLDLIQATAKQIAVAINNAQLYLLIRDQAERLGSMLRTQQIEASRSRAILESVADGVLVTDINDFISLFNASAEEITSLKGDQVVGKSLDDFIGLFGGAAQAWMQTIHTWSEDPSTYSPGEIFTEQIELEDGRVVAVSLAPVILRDELLGTVSIFRDITHQVEVDRLKSEFVATVSHELRTPMTSIKGYVEVLLLGAAGELNPQQSEFLQTVQNNTERLNILVNDLLDVSRIEAGKTTFLSQPLAIDKIAEEVVASLIRRSRNENKPMNIVLTTPPDLPPAVGDKDLLNQILSKLVDNAYNYTPSSGHITVSMQAHEHEIQVDIQDTGIGIAKSDQERVFDRFYRGEDPLVLATAGTGLGLSIVKQLVEMHNGRLWMKSSGVHGEGSTFSFTLPVYQVDKEA
jgi:PAS domain S-box-containing protein